MSLIRAHHLWIAAFIALTIGKNKLQLCLLLLLPLEKYSSGPYSDINAVKKIRLTFFFSHKCYASFVAPYTVR